jgi:hypothetical protein
MNQKMRNTESCEASQNGDEEQVRTLLELVTEIYNALEKEKRLVARDPEPAAGSLGWPSSRRKGSPVTGDPEGKKSHGPGAACASAAGQPIPPRRTVGRV